MDRVVPIVDLVFATRNFNRHLLDYCDKIRLDWSVK
jgi:hypothetical protein